MFFYRTSGRSILTAATYKCSFAFRDTGGVRERERERGRERESEKRGGDKEGESTTRTATKERHGEEWEEREGKSTAAFFYERFYAVWRMEKALARL